MIRSTLLTLIVLVMPLASIGAGTNKNKKDYDFAELMKEGQETQNALHENLRKNIHATQESEAPAESAIVQDEAESPVRVRSSAAIRERAKQAKALRATTKSAAIEETEQPSEIDKMFDN
ncbi:MAG: hypothetical protein AB7O96_10100 [Pseudobdellovibrionaceae bacterium]